MSEEEAPAPKPEKPAAVGGPKPSKAVLAIAVLNLAATGFIAFKIMTTPPAAAAVAAAPHGEHAESSTEISGPVTEMDPFVVNLNEPTSRYLKVTLQLELASHDVQEKFDKGKQLVRDAILGHLSGLTVKDTLGADAKEKLKTEIKERVQKLLGEASIKRVFFQEFVVQ